MLANIPINMRKTMAFFKFYMLGAFIFMEKKTTK